MYEKIERDWLNLVKKIDRKIRSNIFSGINDTDNLIKSMNITKSGNTNNDKTILYTN